MNLRVRILLFVLIVGMLIPTTVLADPPPFNPLKQPHSQSPYGMDIMGPGWQWTFPRESAWPRLAGPIRVDQLDEVIGESYQAGVRSARVSVWWCMTEPARDQYVWDDLDVVFQIASNYGITPLPEIYYTPDWAAVGYVTGKECVNPNGYRNLPPTNLDDWSDFMADFVQRYGAIGKDQVHDWEIWNEPDLWEFWYVPWDPSGAGPSMYAHMVKRARQEIDRFDPGGRLLLGGFSDIYGPDFLKKLLALRGPYDIRQDVDIVTFHVFTDHVGKIRNLKNALDGNPFELWITELNSDGWTESVTAQKVAALYDTLAGLGITRSYWFKAWTTGWGPGIFVNRDPIWEPGPFTPSAFYNTFKNQSFTDTLPGKPTVLAPGAAISPDGRPVFVWQRPNAGSKPIVGYKLQAENSFYQNKLYFHSPELDVFVPASHIQFLPMQQVGSRTAANAAETSTPAAITPAASTMSYQPSQPLPSGLLWWRVAAVDSDGNVGPYSGPYRLVVGGGKDSMYLPMQYKSF
ncbi:MAG: hypothetical protein J5I90_18330 [Caldilineales bacterium]|nr:hypothetical protein [Caldilineales bacterium]